MDDTEIAALGKWFAESVAVAIGPERAEIIASQGTETWSWLRDPIRLLISFRDFGGDRSSPLLWTDPDYIISIIREPTYPGRQLEFPSSGRPLQGQNVPPELQFLFIPLSENPAVRRRIAR